MLYNSYKIHGHMVSKYVVLSFPYLSNKVHNNPKNPWFFQTLILLYVKILLNVCSFWFQSLDRNADYRPTFITLQILILDSKDLGNPNAHWSIDSKTNWRLAIIKNTHNFYILRNYLSFGQNVHLMRWIG